MKELPICLYGRYAICSILISRGIGVNAFAECHQLKKVTLDSELTQEVVVEDGAFAYCEALESCDLVGSENVEFKNDVFIGTQLQG